MHSKLKELTMISTIGLWKSVLGIRFCCLQKFDTPWLLQTTAAFYWTI